MLENEAREESIAMVANTFIPYHPLDIGVVRGQFSRHFTLYQEKVDLPVKIVSQRRPGTIHTKSLTIDYRFGRDRSGETLDFTATWKGNRTTRWRIHWNGSSEQLPPLVCEICGTPGQSLCDDCIVDLISHT